MLAHSKKLVTVVRHKMLRVRVRTYMRNRRILLTSRINLQEVVVAA